MQDSNSAKTLKRHWFILAIWLIFTFIAFALAVNARLVAFDPNQQLATTDLSLTAQHINRFMPQLITQDNHTAIIHFTQDNCQCQQYSQKHINSINEIAAKNAYKIAQVKLTSDEILIPSTPSVAIIKHGNLVYFGPYGQGIACSQTNGFAQTVLNNLTKGYAANVILSNAKGCYCQV